MIYHSLIGKYTSPELIYRDNRILVCWGGMWKTLVLLQSTAVWAFPHFPAPDHNASNMPQWWFYSDQALYSLPTLKNVINGSLFQKDEVMWWEALSDSLPALSWRRLYGVSERVWFSEVCLCFLYKPSHPQRKITFYFSMPADIILFLLFNNNFR